MLIEKFNELKDVVEDLESDIVKSEDGIKARISKARKKLQSVKKIAQALRVELQEKKKELYNKPVEKPVEEPVEEKSTTEEQPPQVERPAVSEEIKQPQTLDN